MKKKIKKIKETPIKLAHVHLIPNVCPKAPVSGTALYYARRFKDGQHVMLLHPITLDCFKISRRTFEHNVTTVYIPKPLIVPPNGYKCDRIRVAEVIQEQLRKATERARVPEKNYLFIRSAIADLKQVSIKDIPDYRMKVPDWQKRTERYLKTVEVKEQIMNKHKPPQTFSGELKSLPGETAKEWTKRADAILKRNKEERKRYLDSFCER